VPAPAPRAPAAAEEAKGPPAPGKGGLSGIYLGVKRQLVAPGPGSGVQHGITWLPERDWLTFFPDGRVYAALPVQGLGVPFVWDCGTDDAWCPTYSVRGSDLRVTWATGFEKRFTRQKDGALRHQGVDYVPLAPLTGVVLEGRYAAVGNEYREGFIVFREDGTFQEQGFTRDLMLTPSEHQGGAGAYSVRANTLELRYADGSVVRTSVYAMPEHARESPPSVLWVNGWDYHRGR
jgi:hypothetical protein